MAINEALVILPQIMQYIQLIGYVVMALFFGSIAMKGWKGYLPWHLKLAARLGAGFLCVLSGVSIGPFITGLRSGILRVFQLDLITVGIISAILFSVAFFLISSKSEAALESLKRHVKKTENKIKKMGVPPKGMTIHKWAGIAIIAALVALSAVTFRGFPGNAAQELFKSMGLPEEIANLSPECMSAFMAMTSMGQKVENPPLYENAALKSIIEQGSGKTVFEMYRLENEGRVIIAAKTTEDKTCFATEAEFCMCPSE